MNDIWSSLSESFDMTLPRMSAITIKENDYDLGFYCPSSDNRIGYHFLDTCTTAYNQDRYTLEFYFAAYEYPNLCNQPGKTHFLFSEQSYHPGQISHKFVCSNSSLAGKESLSAVTGDALHWSFDLENTSVPLPDPTHIYRYSKKIYSVFLSHDRFEISAEDDNTICIALPGNKYFISCNLPIKTAVFDNELDAFEAMGTDFSDSYGCGRVLLVENDISIDTGEHLNLSFGLSHHSHAAAVRALDSKNPDDILRKKWNSWFESLPTVGFEEASDDEKKLYYKAWWVLRINFCKFRDWGFNVLESLPVYKGIWQWAIPAVEWYSSQDPEHPCEWFKTAMNILVNAQKDNGYITHAAYLHEDDPGSFWLQTNTIQNPQLPGTALRYYNVTGDTEALKRWYPSFRKYYDYLCRDFDECHKNLHLWALHTSFDTGLDTFPAFQEVTYGINGNEPTEYCYGAILSAERFHYERSMGKIASIINYDDDIDWEKEALATKEAINRILWDDDKNWYGVLQADGRLDTRVGVDGLFPLIYDIADDEKLAALKPQFMRLIGKYGIYTTAPGEDDFYSDIYWRGPCWPKTCSLAIAVAKKHFPDLLNSVHDSVLTFGLSYPNIWECIDVTTGKIARHNSGHCCTPCMSSNVGAGELIGALWLYHGMDMFGTAVYLPLIPMKGYHYRGLYISISKKGESFEITAKASEATENDIEFFIGNEKKISVHIVAAEKYILTPSEID